MHAGTPMRKASIALLMMLLMIVPSVQSQPESLIDLKLEDTLSDNDLGIKTGAVSPDGLRVLIAGEDGYQWFRGYFWIEHDSRRMATIRRLRILWSR